MAVQRHLNLVYGTAVRKVQDQGAAEEVTQNVFAAMARKAWQFGPDDSLPAWLHQTALLEAKRWLRGELRRRRREQSAAELGTTMKAPDEEPALHSLFPLLDEGLLSLREKDRAALLLRYYQSQSLREIGAWLGVGEDAAQKRVASALEKLAQFFQRRGFKTARASVAAAALQKTATSAPAVVAAAVAQGASQLTPPAMLGFATLLSRFAGLTKMQTATLCAAIAAVPLAWQWNETRATGKAAASTQSSVGAARAQEEQLSAEIERLRAESARLSAAVTQAAQVPAGNVEARRRWEALRVRIRGLLADGTLRWPDDLPYVRLPKSVGKQLELQAKFNPSGAISETALELFGITADEKIFSERALGDYWKGVEGLMAARAYETNMPSLEPGRVVKTVIVPPLGQELKTLADETRAQLTQELGAERERLLFGGWDEGAIQIFWPGNLWKIAEEPQQFSVWVEPAAADANGPRHGTSWRCSGGGTSSEGQGSSISLGSFTRFFAPWLEQFGVTTQ